MSHEVVKPDGVRVVGYRHPFTAERIDFVVREGATVAELINEAELDDYLKQHLVIAIHDKDLVKEPWIIPQENWSKIRPHDGHVVSIRLGPRGGGGKNPLRIILQIAVIGLAIAIPAALPIAIANQTVFGIASLTVGKLIGGLITALGSFLINALIPPPSPNLPRPQGADPVVPSITGARNNANPYGSIPKLFGTFRIYPPFAAQPYTETEDNDQYLRLLFAMHGPISIQDLRIGNTPITDFEGVDYEIREGWDDDTPITLYPSDVFQEDFSLKVTNAGGPIVRTASQAADELHVDISFPQLTIFNESDGSRSEATVDIEIEYRKAGSADPWKPATSVITTDPLSFGPFNGPQLETVDGNFSTGTTVTTFVVHNLTGKVTFYTSTETLGDSPGAIAPKDLGQPPDTTKLWEYKVTKNKQTAPIDDDPPIINYVTVFTDLRPAPFVSSGWFVGTENIDRSIDIGSGEITPPTFRVVDDSTSAVRRTYRWQPQVRDTYEVRVTRVTADASDDLVRDESFWIALRAIAFDPPITYPIPLAQIAVRIKATDQLNGIVDALNFLGTSYAPVWNSGTSEWQYQPTNNPAWLYIDALVGRHAHDIPPVAEDTIILTDIIDWATENETEGRTCGIIMESEGTIFDHARLIAGIGRAAITERNGKFTVLREQVSTGPVQHFTPRNSNGFKLVKTFIDVPHALITSFANEDADFIKDQIFVYDDGFNINNATKFGELDLPGVINADHAWKLGRYHIAQVRLRPETYEFTTDIENIACLLGDEIAITHDVMLVGVGSATVKSVTKNGSDEVTHVTLDAEFTLAATPHSLFIRFSDDPGNPTLITTAIHDVTNSNETTDTFEFVTPIPNSGAQPVTGDLVSLGETGKETLLAKVKTIQRREDLEATITAVPAAPGVLTADTGSIPAFDPQITLPADVNYTPPPAPMISNIITNENAMVLTKDGDLDIGLVIEYQWSAGAVGAPAEFLEAQIRPYSATVTNFGPKYGKTIRQPIGSSSVRFASLQEGAAYDVRIRSISGGQFPGLVSAWVEQTNITIQGDTGAPDDPVITSLVESLQRGARTLTWTQAFAADLKSFDIRIDGADLFTLPKESRQAILDSIPLYGAHTVSIRSKDTFGNASAWVDYSITPLALPTLNIGETVTIVQRNPNITIDVTWSNDPSTVYNEVWLIEQGQEAALITTVNGTSYSFKGFTKEDVGEDLSITVVPVKADGARPAKVFTQHTIQGDITAPSQPVPTVIENTIRGSRQVLFNMPSVPPDISRYEVLIDGIVSATASAGATEVDVTIPLTGTHTVAVRAYDTSENFSEGSIVLTPLTNVANLQAVENIRFVARFAVSDIALTWDAKAGAVYYEVWKVVSGENVLLGTTETNSFTEQNVDNGQTPIEPTIFEDPPAANPGVLHTYKVLAVKVDGARSTVTSAAQVNVTALGDGVVPPDVIDFTVEETSERFRRFWWDTTPFTAIPDLAGFQIRWSRSANTPFTEMTILSQSLLPRPPFELRALPAGLAIVAIRAVDTSGNISANSAVIKFNLGDRLLENVLLTYDHRDEGQSPGSQWAGTIVEGEEDLTHGYLITTDLGDQFYTNGTSAAMYSNDANLMYGSTFGEVDYNEDITEHTGGILTLNARAIGPVRHYYAVGTGPGYEDDGEFEIGTAWTLGGDWTVDSNIGKVATISGATVQSDLDQVITGLTIGVDYVIEYQVNEVSGADLVVQIDGVSQETAHRRKGRHQVIFKATATSHTMRLRATIGCTAEIENFFWRDFGWSPWTSPVFIPYGDMRTRIRVLASRNVSRVYEFFSIVDVPDLIEVVEDVAVAAAGTRVPPTKDFRELKAVGLILQDDASIAVTAKVVDKDVLLGPLIKAYDKDGASVTATLDVTLQGW